jgi:hypothetical protein
MKLDPGIHIGTHLVSFGKSGVTAMHLPQGAGARDIAVLLTRRLHLQPGEVTVTLNQPEHYLIRFQKVSNAARAREKGRFTGGGIDICGAACHMPLASVCFTGCGCSWMATPITRARRPLWSV